MNRKIKKIVLLGEAGVGKTSLSKRLINDTFNNNVESTVGAAFYRFNYKDHAIDIWDTAGQERYLSLAPIYYRGADVLLLAYDMNELETLDRLEHYIKKAINESYKKFGCIIIGCKKDLIEDENIKNIDELVKEKFDKYNNLLVDSIIFKYVSSKTGENVGLLKDDILNLAIKVNNENEKSEDGEIDDIINILQTKDNSFSSYCYC